MNKHWKRKVLNRRAYPRYKAVFDAAKESPEAAVEAAFWLVESYRGHHRWFVANAARDTVKFIIEEDEFNMVRDTPKKKLPLLLGTLKYESSEDLLLSRLTEK